MAIAMDANTLHHIALLATAMAETFRGDLEYLDRGDRDYIYQKGYADALDDFAENLWLRINDIGRENK